MPRLRSAIENCGCLQDVLALLENLFLYEDYFGAFDLKSWTIDPSTLPPSLRASLHPTSTTLPTCNENPKPSDVAWQLIRSGIGTYYTNSICQKLEYSSSLPLQPHSPSSKSPPPSPLEISAPLYYDHKGPLSNHFSLGLRRSRYRRLTTSSSAGGNISSSMRRTSRIGAAAAISDNSSDRSPPDLLSLPEILVHSIVCLSQMRGVTEETRKIISATAHMIRTFPALSPDLVTALIESYALLITYSAPFIGAFKDHISAAVLNHMKIPSSWIHKVHLLSSKDQARVLAHALKVLILLDMIRAGKSGRSHPSALLIRTRRALGGGAAAPTNPTILATQITSNTITPPQDVGDKNQTISTAASAAVNNTDLGICRSWEFIVWKLSQDLNVIRELPHWIPTLIETPLNNILRICKSPRKLTNLTALDPEHCLKNIFRSAPISGGAVGGGSLKKIPSSSNDEANGGGGGGSPPRRSETSAASQLRSKRLRFPLAVVYTFRKIHFADSGEARRASGVFNPITLLWLTCERDSSVLGSAIELSLKRDLWEVCQDLEKVILSFEKSGTTVGGVSEILRTISRVCPECYSMSSVLRKIRISQDEDELLLANEQFVEGDQVVGGGDNLAILASACYDQLPEPLSAGQIFKSLPHIRPILQARYPIIVKTTTTTTTGTEDEGSDLGGCPPAQSEERRAKMFEEDDEDCGRRRRLLSPKNEDDGRFFKICQCKRPHLQVRSRRRRKDPAHSFLGEKGRVGWSVIHGMLLRQNLCQSLLPESAEVSPDAAAALLAEYIKDLRCSRKFFQPSQQQQLWLLEKADLWISVNKTSLFTIWGWQSIYHEDDSNISLLATNSLLASSGGPGADTHSADMTMMLMGGGGSIGQHQMSEDLNNQMQPPSPRADEFSNWDNSIPEDQPDDNDANILRYASYSLITELLHLVEDLQRSNRKTPKFDNLFQNLAQNILMLFSGHSPADLENSKQLFTLEPLQNVQPDQLHKATCQQILFQAALYSLYIKLIAKHKKASYAPLTRSSIDMEISGCRILINHQIQRLCLTRYNALHPVRSSLSALVLAGPTGSSISPDARRNMLFARSDQMQEAIMKIVSVVKQACSDDSKITMRKLRREMIQTECSRLHEELKEKGVLAQLLLVKGEPLICSRSRRILTRLKQVLAPGQSPSISDALSSVLLWHDRKIPFHHYQDHHYLTSHITELGRNDLQQISVGILSRKYISANLLATNNLELDRLLTLYANQERFLYANTNCALDRLVKSVSLDPGAPPLPVKRALFIQGDHSEQILAKAVSMATSSSEILSHIPQFMHQAIRNNSMVRVWFEILNKGANDQAFLNQLHRTIVSDINVACSKKSSQTQKEGTNEMTQLLRMSQFGVMLLGDCQFISQLLKSSEFVEELVMISGAASKVEARDREKFVRDAIVKVCKAADLPTHGRVDGEGGVELEYGSSLQPSATELKQIVSMTSMLRSKIIAECQAKSSPVSSLARPAPQLQGDHQSLSLAQFSVVSGGFYTMDDRRRGSCSPINLAASNSNISSQGAVVDGSSQSVAQSEIVGVISPVNGQKIIGVDIESVRILKSAAKVPYMIKFEKAPSLRNNAHSLIFKCNDDIRQDMLVHQISCLMNSIFVGAGLPLRIITYKAVPVILRDLAGPRSCCVYGGIIEMLEDCKSRHEIGNTYGLTLDGYYSRLYGSQSLEPARWNFTTSLAAASLLTFILQIKDRHNANILLTHDGFLVHIDFGFILDLAPAHDLKFERAPFKLTNEMIGLIDGGSQDSSGTLLLRQLITHGYLALRAHRQEIVGLIGSYEHSNVRGFKAASISNLKTRLQYDKSDHDATEYILRQTRAAVNALTTRLYDVFQSVQQGIAF